MCTCEKINYRRTLDSDGLCVESALDKVLGGGSGSWGPSGRVLEGGLGLWGASGRVLEGV